MGNKTPFIFFALSLLLCCSVPSCTSIIKEDLELRLEDLKDRVTNLEELCRKANTNISSIQAILDAVAENEFITAVSEIKKDGVVEGYNVTFSTGATITIYNGTDGTDGYIPELGVATDSDGIYYWTLDGKWISNAEGGKLRAENVVPKFRIEEEFWYVTYDNGTTWEKLGKATGEDGESLLLSINQIDNKVEFKLADGTSFTLPKISEVKIIIENEEGLACMPGASIYIGYQLQGVVGEYQIEAVSDNGWKSSVERDGEFSGRIRIQAPDGDKPGKVLVFVSDMRGQTTIKSINFEKGILSLVNDAYRLDWNGGSIKVPVKTNLEYSVRIPEYLSWVSFEPTKAVRTDVLEFSLMPYPGEGPVRTADVELVSNTGSVLETITFVQLSEPTDNAIAFADSVAKAACIAAGVDVNMDGEISYKEAAETTWLPNAMFENFRTVKSFKELQYFTGITSLPWYMFRGCDMLEEVVIPENITSLDGYVFHECRMLENVKLPKTITNMGGGNFNGCTSLMSIELPPYITSIGHEEFRSCVKLREIVIPAGVTYIGDWAFADCSGITSFEIPEDVYYLGGGCFFGCSSLKKVNIPKSVTWINWETFYGCISLLHIDIPDNVQGLGDRCFGACSGLSAVHIPESVQTIERQAFMENRLQSFTGKFATPDRRAVIYQDMLIAVAFSSGESYSVPETVTVIGASAFAGSNFKSVKLNEGVKVIEYNAFYNTALESVIIPSTVESIESWAFASYNLKSVNFAVNSCLKNIGDYAFNNTSCSEIILPETVSYMGYGAFCYSFNLKRIEIPEKVTSIMRETFAGCYTLEEVIFKGDIIHIGERAFESCHALKQISIPQSVGVIGNQAFQYCYELRNIYCYPLVVPGLGVGAFYAVNENCTIHVPSQVLGDYRTHYSWMEYAKMMKAM